MSYDVIYDKDELITRYVCDKLKFGYEWLGAHLTFGFTVDDKLVGGLIFHDYRPDGEIWWTIYTDNKRWCNRRMLRFMFGLAFKILQCRRISISVDAKNKICLKFVQKLGFKQEGILRAQRDDGSDNIVLGMLKTECNWI